MARDFNGANQKLEIPTHSTLNSSAFTVGGFIKARSFGNGTVMARIIGSTSVLSLIVNSSGGVTFSWDYTITDLDINTPVGIIKQNEWMSLYIAGDGGSAHAGYDIYVNGILQPHDTSQSNDGSGSPQPLSGTVARIGLGFFDINDFNGRMAHFQMFSRKLRGVEILSMSRIPGSIPRGLVSYIPMIGGSPEPDYSGLGNAAAVTGAEYVAEDNPPILGMFYPRFSRMMRYAVPASVNPEVEWELHDSYPIFMNMKFASAAAPAVAAPTGRRRRRTLVGVGR